MSTILARVALIAGCALLSAHALAWTVTADFESGANGSRANGPDAFGYALQKSTYSNQQAFQGNQSARMEATQGSTSTSDWGGIVSFPEHVPQGGEVWMRAFYYFPNSWNWTTDTGSLKAMRIRMTNTAGNPNGYPSINIEGSDRELRLFNEPAGGFPYKNLGLPVQTGSWELIEMYIKVHSTNGIIRIWQNENLVLEQTEIKTIGQATDVASHGYIHTHWNGGAPITQANYVDNLLITTETPQNVDKFGNPRIGGSSATMSNAPTPPSNFTVSIE